MTTTKTAAKGRCTATTAVYTDKGAVTVRCSNRSCAGDHLAKYKGDRTRWTS